MDRNIRREVLELVQRHVALRKESVDRNINIVTDTPAFEVALRKESVDRNSQDTRSAITQVLSLSARRAWIEMAAVIYS